MVKKKIKNIYAGRGLIFGAALGLFISLILDLPIWYIGIGAGLGLVFGSMVDTHISDSG
mgnify:CR=1 FL=1